MSCPKQNCCIVVLGDFGRSPRMQYHTQSLLEDDFQVDVISYTGSQPLHSIRSNSNAKFHYLREFPNFQLPSLIQYILKTVWQILSLMIAFCTVSRPTFVLIQNPPAVPTFLVCFIYCKITGSRFIIDWHNYTHTILALNCNPNGLIVKISRWIEMFFGRRADASFCVTKAMKRDLKNNWQIEATVLYDRPPEQFQPITVEEVHELFMKLSENFPSFSSKDDDFVQTTSFTQKNVDGSITYKADRPAILISSTSWTPDEDFGILLTALEEYEKASQASVCYPKLLCIITGKGPQKKFYENLISNKRWKKVDIITPWLEADEYPLLLASADLGVCLHWSSSGLDLPMKVVDMFGVGLIVCAKNFNCLNELVRHEKNGFVFETPMELATQLLMWFEDFPDNPKVQSKRKIFQDNLEQFQSLRWRENWSLVARPVLNINC